MLFQQISINRLLEPLYKNEVLKVCVFQPLTAVTLPEKTVLNELVKKLEVEKLDAVVCPIFMVKPVIVLLFAEDFWNRKYNGARISDVTKALRNAPSLILESRFRALRDGSRHGGRGVRVGRPDGTDAGPAGPRRQLRARLP